MKKMKAPEGLGLENYKFTELPLNKIFYTKDRLKIYSRNHFRRI